MSEQTLQAQLTALREELAGLRAAMQARVTLTVQSSSEPLFLGQSEAIDVLVRDGDNRPIANAKLTLITSWGVLDSGQGSQSAVTVQTSADGIARVILRSVVARQLVPNQQAAVDAALAKFDRTAATPLAMEKQLRELVTAYRWEPNTRLRNALDAYFEYYRADIVMPVNTRNGLQTWDQFQATISIHAVGERGNILASALHTVPFLNWVGAWLRLFQRASRQETSLGNALNGNGETGDTGKLLDNVYGRVRDYVGQQYGRVGEFVAERVAKQSLHEFMTTEITALPAETRATLFPAVRLAEGAVTKDGVNLLSALTQARVDVRREVDSKVAAIDLSGIDNLQGRVAELETGIAGKLDSAEFTTTQQAIQRALADKLDASTHKQFVIQTFQPMRDQVRELDAFRADASDRFTAIERDTTQLVVDFSQFRDDFGGRIQGLEVATETLEAGLEKKVDNDRFTAIERNTVQLTRDFVNFRNNFGGRIQDIEVATETLAQGLEKKVDSADFNTFQQRNTDILRRKANADDQNQLREQMTLLQGNVQALDQNMVTVSRRVDLGGIVIRPIFPIIP